MAWFLVAVVIVALVGVGWRIWLAGRPGGRAPRRVQPSDVTDTRVVPPAHPDRPRPGSDARRHDQGKP